MRDQERPPRPAPATTHQAILTACAAVFWALALAGATAGFVVGRLVYERGVVYGDPGPALPDLDGPQRAINTQLELEPDAEAQRHSLRLIRQAGFGWIRQQFQWAEMEPAKGQFYDPARAESTWARYDQMVALARAEGLRVIARIDRPPSWARPPGSYETAPPRDVRDFADFVTAFVEHYRGQIDHIQIWNEPNLNTEWGQRPDDPPGTVPVDPAHYVQLLKAGYEAAKRANPAVRVLSAALAQTLEPDAPGANGLDDLLYLDRMYQYGARPYFDILAANAYGLRTGPDDRLVSPRHTNFSRVLLTRDVMLRHGDAGKAVWVAEFGWNALPPSWKGAPSPWGQVSERQQAAYIVGAYERARQEWPWMGPMALWLFKKPGAHPDDPTPYFSIVDAGARPRPAYEALARTAGAPVLGPGVHQESSAGLTFTGTWQWTPDASASLGAFRESPISGATMRARFFGSSVEVVAPVGPSRGIAFVRINGTALLANRLPLNRHGQAVLDFYAPEPQPQRRLAIASGLPAREHELEITVSGEHAPAAQAPGVGIDAIVVSRARPVLPALALGGAGAGSLLAALWLLRPAIQPRLERLALAPTADLAALAEQATWQRLWRQAVDLPWRRLAVLALAASLPLAPLTLPTPAGRYSPVELLAVLCAGAGAVRLYLWGRLGRWGAFGGPALLLAVAGLVSLVVADYPRLALRELRTLILEPVAFYFVARSAFHGPRDALRLSAALVAGATAASLLALLQALTGLGLIAAEGVGRATATYPSPNNLALFLDRAVPLAAALALARPSPAGPARRAVETDGRPRPAGLARALWAAAALAGAAALFFTFSRGAWIATAVALLVVTAALLPRRLLARRRRVLALAAGLGLLLLVAGAMLALRVERFGSLIRPEGTGVLRIHLWQAAADMIRDHPLWGIGLDQFLYHYPRYIRPEAWREPNLSHPHNILLDFWLRLGILGLVALAWGAWMLARLLRLAPGAPGTAVPRALQAGAAGAAVAMLVHGLVDNSYFVLDLAYTTWIICLVAELAPEPDHRPARRDAAPSLGCASAGVASPDGSAHPSLVQGRR
jgi:O-antigen ligase